MKIETELDAGDAAYVLVENRITLQNIIEVRIAQATRYIGGKPEPVVVEYLVKIKGETEHLVPERRVGRTKEDLLKKL